MAFVNNITLKNRLQIGAETLVRRLNFGTDWQKLNIGFRCSLADTLSQISASVLIVGVMQGTYGWPDPACPDAVGGMVGCSSLYGSAWDRLRDGSGNMSYRSGGTNSIRKQFNVYRLGGSNGANSLYVPLTHTGQLGSFIVQIEKLSTTVSAYCNGTAPASITRSSFLSAMENPTMNPTPTGYATVGNSAVSHTDSRLFDSVFVFWNHSTPAMDIVDFSVCRLG